MWSTSVIIWSVMDRANMPQILFVHLLSKYFEYFIYADGIVSTY
jgi:hypothetical protein